MQAFHIYKEEETMKAMVIDKYGKYPLRLQKLLNDVVAVMKGYKNDESIDC